ncbi:MAG: hypothetical protein AAF251_06325 [Pseudomonadota bacterium]
MSVSVSLAGALAACGNSASTPSPTAIESEAPTPDLSECILKVIELDEGRSEYTGTIARVDGGVRTYVTTSIHSSNGDGTWTNKSFGGDVGGTEDDAEVSVVTVEGNFVIPIENGKLNREAAVEITACDGPDPEGRYEVKKSYKIPVEGGSFDYATNVSWYGERGSYYAEDLRDPDGRIIARRSGVYLPVHE